MPKTFKGPLHEATSTADTDKCAEPKMDSDPDFIQYCFTRLDDLGSERLFIEFNVTWDEWLGATDIDCDHHNPDYISAETRVYDGKEVATYDKPPKERGGKKGRKI